jgi:hypothetical protein
VVIGAELGRKDHCSIPATAIGRGWNLLIPKLTLKSDSTGGEKKKTLLT